MPGDVDEKVRLVADQLANRSVFRNGMLVVQFEDVEAPARDHVPTCTMAHSWQLAVQRFVTSHGLGAVRLVKESTVGDTCVLVLRQFIDGTPVRGAESLVASATGSERLSLALLVATPPSDAAMSTELTRKRILALAPSSVGSADVKLARYIIPPENNHEVGRRILEATVAPTKRDGRIVHLVVDAVSGALLASDDGALP